MKLIIHLSKQIQFFIKGVDSREYVMQMLDSATVLDLKTKIFEQMGYTVNSQFLSFQNSSFNEVNTLFENYITEDSTIHLCLK